MARRRKGSPLCLPACWFTIYIYIHTYLFYMYLFIYSFIYSCSYLFICLVLLINIYIYIYIHTYIYKVGWVFIKGGCSGRGVQWIGVVLYNKLVYNII